MQLRRLHLENFRQHASTELLLGPGVTAIIGPNGSGKTTLLEAIAWAFYGTQAARGTRDFIRWNRAPARASVRVEVEFGLGAHEYRVVRTLSTAELFQDGGDSAVADSPREVTARLERLLGMSREEFFHTYFTGQKELAAFQAMKPAERARFLSRVLGYEKLKLAQDRLRDTRSTLRGELAGLEAGLADAGQVAAERDEAAGRLATAEAALGVATAAREAARARRDAVGPAWTRMVELRESLVALDGDRRVAEQHVEAARVAFQRLDKALAEALEARTRLAELAPGLADVAPLRAELETLEHEARAAGRRQQLTGERVAIDQALAALDQRLAVDGDPVAAERAAREARDARQAELTAARDAWQRDKADAASQRRSLLDQYRDVDAHRKRIETTGADGECPTCRRPLGAEFADVVGTLTRQLEDIELNGKFFAQRLKQLEREPDPVRAAQRAADAAQEALAAATVRARELAEARRERERQGARLAAIVAELAALPGQYDAERLDQVRAALREREPLVQQAARLQASADHAERLVQEAEAAEQALSTRERTARELAEAIAALGFEQAAFDAARQQFELATRTLQDAEVEVATRAGDQRAAAQGLAAAERRVAERAARAERADLLRADLALHDELDRALGDLRSELNAQLRPELAELASRLLGDITDGRYDEIELDEQYDVLVLEHGEAKPVISGGEEDIAHLALRLAISQMVAGRAGQPLALLVLDEIFGSLDEARRAHVLSLLRGLGDRFPQVVLITHIESVRDAVDRVVRVQLDAARGAAVVADDPGHDDVAA